MEIIHHRCAGLDVHKDSVVVCFRQIADGHVAREIRTFDTTTTALLDLSAWLQEKECSHVAMEATGVYWKPLWHLLEDNFSLVLGNAREIRNVPGRKSDVNDASWIADLLAHGLIRASFVPPMPVQELRDLTRTRKQLAREIVQHTQRIQKTLQTANIKLKSVLSDILGHSGRAILSALLKGETNSVSLAQLADTRVKASRAKIAEALRGKLTEHHRFLIRAELSIIDALSTMVGKLERRLDKLLSPLRAQVEQLATIPGVSTTTAQIILAEVGPNVSRFPRPEALRSWAGLCPRLDESAGKRKSTRTRSGNAWLKTALVQAAWAASRVKKTYLSAQFHRLKSRRGPKKAAVAVAASILTAAYCMLRDGTTYRDLGPTHFNARHRSRTTKRLLQHLADLGVVVEVRQMAAS